MADILTDVINAFRPDNPIAIFLIVAIAAGALFAFFKIMRLREPKGKKIDRFIFSMPYQGEIFEATAYEDPELRDIVNLEELEQLDEAKALVADLKKHWNRLYFYDLKYERMDRSTRDNGRAILMTHARLDADGYSNRTDSQINWLTLTREQVRIMVQAADYGRIFRDVDGLDLIYYPAIKPVAGEQALVNLQNPHGTMAVVALIREAVRNIGRIRQLEAKNRALENNFNLANSETARQVQRRGLVEIENAKKPPFQISEALHSPAMPALMVFAVILGALIVLPPIIRSIVPGVDQTSVNLMAAVMGGVAVFALQNWRR